MSYVIRHPNGRYVQAWYSEVSKGQWELTRVALVPKADASSYDKRSETREVVSKFFEGTQMEVQIR
jgi:hypothetical protein